MRTCAVPSCDSNTKSGYRFYAIPSDKVTQNIDNVLQAKRRKLWLVALRRKDLSRDLTGNIIKSARVCSRHFINEEPAALEAHDHPDWVPCIDMGYPSRWPKAKFAKILKLQQQRSEAKLNELTKKLSSLKQIKKPLEETPISSISPFQYDENLPNTCNENNVVSSTNLIHKVMHPTNPNPFSSQNNTIQNEEFLPEQNIYNDIKIKIDITEQNLEYEQLKLEEIEIEPDLPDVIFVSEEIIEPMAPLEEEEDDTVKEEIVTDFDLPNEEYLHLPTLEPEVIEIEDNMLVDETETPPFLPEENCTYSFSPKTHTSIKDDIMPIKNEPITKIEDSSDLLEEVYEENMQVYEFYSPKYLNIEESNRNVISTSFALKNVILEYTQEIQT